MFSVRDTYSEISFVTRARAIYYDVTKLKCYDSIYVYTLFFENKTLIIVEKHGRWKNRSRGRKWSWDTTTYLLGMDKINPDSGDSDGLTDELHYDT